MGKGGREAGRMLRKERKKYRREEAIRRKQGRKVRNVRELHMIHKRVERKGTVKRQKVKKKNKRIVSVQALEEILLGQ